uniref:Uncharacterized protein n=1 Tax=Timema bartmani TaxID=61472 RepID=A0A7R9F4U0_9NEOP|nr:unnamed protein product [Timema bartmani]
MDSFNTTYDNDYQWRPSVPFLNIPKRPPKDTQPRKGIYMRRPVEGACTCDGHGWEPQQDRYRCLADKERRLCSDLVALRKQMTDLCNSIMDHPCGDAETKLESLYRSDYKVKEENKPNLSSSKLEKLEKPITQSLTNYTDTPLVYKLTPHLVFVMKMEKLILGDLEVFFMQDDFINEDVPTSIFLTNFFFTYSILFDSGGVGIGVDGDVFYRGVVTIDTIVGNTHFLDNVAVRNVSGRVVNILQLGFPSHPSIIGLNYAYRDPTSFRYLPIVRPNVNPSRPITFGVTPHSCNEWFQPLPVRTEYQDTISKVGRAIVKSRQQYREPMPSTRRRPDDPCL